MKKYGLLLLLLVNMQLANADSVAIQHVKLEEMNNQWTASVTLLHADSGWDHYADGWRVVDGKGKEIAYRKLWHPHVNEQPFTRSLSGFSIPGGQKVIYVEAHDKVHGWSKDRVMIDLGETSGPRFTVKR